MNAKPILLATLISGCALGIAVAAAQQKDEPVIPSAALKAGQSALELARSVTTQYECTLSYHEGGRASPVIVSAANTEDAQRNAIALGTPTAASCVSAAGKLMP